MAALTGAELAAIQACQELMNAGGTPAEKCAVLRRRLQTYALADQERAFAMGQAMLSPAAPLREACLAVAPWPSPANFPAMVRASVVAAERMLPPGSGELKKQKVLTVLADFVDAAVASEDCPLTAEQGAALKDSTDSSVELFVGLFSGRDDGAGVFVEPARLVLGCLHLCGHRRQRRIAARQ